MHITIEYTWCFLLMVWTDHILRKMRLNSEFNDRIMQHEQLLNDEAELIPFLLNFSISFSKVNFISK